MREETSVGSAGAAVRGERVLPPAPAPAGAPPHGGDDVRETGTADAARAGVPAR